MGILMARCGSVVLSFQRSIEAMEKAFSSGKLDMKSAPKVNSSYPVIQFFHFLTGRFDPSDGVGARENLGGCWSGSPNGSGFHERESLRHQGG